MAQLLHWIGVNMGEWVEGERKKENRLIIYGRGPNCGGYLKNSPTFFELD